MYEWLTKLRESDLLITSMITDDSKPWYQLIITITISEKTNAFFFGERAFNTNYPKLEKILLAETLSDVTLNSSILENPSLIG